MIEGLTRLIDPVLLCNDLGAAHSQASSHFVRGDGLNATSVKEAVRIAQSNNFMGLVCNSRLLVSLKPLKPLLFAMLKDR